MAKPRVGAAGGLPAIGYVLGKAREAGGVLRLWKRLRSRNACKTCALGMGGARGGMVNEAGHFPEVCKKSVQAQAGDMMRAIPEELLRQMSLDDLARLTPRELEGLGRIAFPLIAGEGDTHFRRIGWDDALERTATALGTAKAADPRRVFFYASGRSSNEAAFLFQLVARAFGTPNVHNCSYYCHAASGVALSRVYGSGTASVVLEDLEKADFALVAGANPASNHPRLVTQLVKLRRRGGKVIVVNPLRELGLERFRLPSDVRSMLFGSRVSDLYVQPHAGGDVAFFVGILKGVAAIPGGLDRTWIAEHAAGFAPVEEAIGGTGWDEIVTASGVPRAKIEEAARMIAAGKRGILLWAMGLTHHIHGVDNILALANVALARGWLGREGAGLLPIRGHSNVQGVGSVGVSPELKEGFARKLEELFEIDVPREGGQHTFSSMEAAEAGGIDAAVLLGGNLFGSNPDRTWAAAALRTIPFSVTLSTKLNEGHVHGRGRTAIVLPVLARDEEPEPTTQESMFNYVRVSEGGEPAVPGEMRSEVDIVSSIAERVLPGGRFPWKSLRSHAKLREAIAATVPGYAAIGGVDSGRNGSGEFQIEGRTFHEGRFATDDGKAHFHVTPIPSAGLTGNELRLMTVRSEGQFNTVVYEEEDLYRGNAHRDVVMMAAADAGQRGLAEGDRVTVTTEAGELSVSVAIVDIRPGNIAMYYPEANALVPGRLDERSKTPAFKFVRATVGRVSP